MNRPMEPKDAACMVFGDVIEDQLDAIINLNKMMAMEYIHNHEIDYGVLLIARSYVRARLEAVIKSLDAVNEDTLLRLKVDFLLNELSKAKQPAPKAETPSEMMARRRIKALQGQQ